MKKALLGCLVVALLLIVVGGGLAYWYFVRPAWNAVSSGAESAKQWAAAADAEKSVENQAPFTEPADGLLSARQVEDFLFVQEATAAALGADAATLEKKYDAMKAASEQDGARPDVSQMMGAMSDLGGLVAKGRQAQVAALNQKQWSVAEFQWVRGQVLAAFPFVGLADEDSEAPAEPASAQTTEPSAQESEMMSKLPPEAQQALAEAKAAGDQAKAAMDEYNNRPEIRTARANAKLLRPYRERLAKALSTSWLGL